MKDKVIVVTGASAGIGESLAEILAKRGARVVLVARREKELEAVAARCGKDALAVTADATSRADHKKVFDAAMVKFGAIDAWVNNAGRGISRLTSQLTDEDIDDMIRVNVKSVLYGMQTVLPHFKERKRGHIVNVSSLLGRVPLAAIRSAYSASKHAMNALTASMRMELRAEFPDIHVSLVSPGVVKTEFGLNALHGGADSRNMPMAQEREEVAEVIANVIETPRADVYTREQYQKMIVGYYAAEDMAVAEAQFGAPPTAPVKTPS